MAAIARRDRDLGQLLADLVDRDRRVRVLVRIDPDDDNACSLRRRTDRGHASIRAEPRSYQAARSWRPGTPGGRRNKDQPLASEGSEIVSQPAGPPHGGIEAK